jgi:hypothetical protein
MSTPFIALVLVLAAIMVWRSWSNVFSIARTMLSARKRAFEKDLRDFRARQAAAAEAEGSARGAAYQLLASAPVLAGRCGLYPRPDSPDGARLYSERSPKFRLHLR